jgi:hypothetical protein
MTLAFSLFLSEEPPDMCRPGAFVLLGISMD